MSETESETENVLEKSSEFEAQKIWAQKIENALHLVAKYTEKPYTYELPGPELFRNVRARDWGNSNQEYYMFRNSNIMAFLAPISSVLLDAKGANQNFISDDDQEFLSVRMNEMMAIVKSDLDHIKTPEEMDILARDSKEMVDKLKMIKTRLEPHQSAA
jgi:hypothetical protein